MPQFMQWTQMQKSFSNCCSCIYTPLTYIPHGIPVGKSSNLKKCSCMLFSRKQITISILLVPVNAKYYIYRLCSSELDRGGQKVGSRGLKFSKIAFFGCLWWSTWKHLNVSWIYHPKFFHANTFGLCKCRDFES